MNCFAGFPSSGAARHLPPGEGNSPRRCAPPPSKREALISRILSPGPWKVKGPERFFLFFPQNSAGGPCKILKLWHNETKLKKIFPFSIHGAWRSLASAFDWGSKGRRFKSCCPDSPCEGLLLARFFCFLASFLPTCRGLRENPSKS